MWFINIAYNVKGNNVQCILQRQSYNSYLFKLVAIVRYEDFKKGFLRRIDTGMFIKLKYGKQIK